MNTLGINHSSNQMRYLPNYEQTAKVQPRDKKLQDTLLPPSEQEVYSKKDALLNKYMDQYRIDAKIDGDKLIINNGSNMGLILKNQITSDELEIFHQKLVENGVSNAIDWQDIENDFIQMGIGFDNAESLNTKIDYISSRYAVLKDRIEKDFSGDEKTLQLQKLERLVDTSKKTIADTYSKSIGSFYEELGNDGISEKMRESILSGIDDRIAQYQNHLSKDDNYTDIGNSEKWLLKDDAYMAARLRDRMSATDSKNTMDSFAPEATNPSFTLHDLGIAGVFAKESTQQLNSLNGAVWPEDEQSIGLDLAVQAMKTDHLTSKTNTSDKMSSLIKNSFSSYMNKYLDKLDQVMENIANKSSVSNTKRKLDRESIISVYDYTMNEYQNSGDIMDATAKGAEKAQKMFNENFAKNGGSYADKQKWDTFFQSSQYGNKDSDVTEYEKFKRTTDIFVNSLNGVSEKNIKLVFAFNGQTSANRYSDFAMDLYA